MPFVLIIAGIVLLVSAVRNTQQVLFGLVAGDFLGPNNFIYWFLSIMVIGAIGYIPKMKPISDGFLILVILGLFLSKKGFFVQLENAFQKQVGSTQTANPSVSPTGGTGTPGVTIGGSSVGITPPTVGLPGGPGRVGIDGRTIV